jgi:hypothetical protein
MMKSLIRRRSHRLVVAALVMLGVGALLAGCGSGKPETTSTLPGITAKEVKPRTPEEKVVVDYYRAINDKDYAAAYALTTANFKSKYGSLADFTAYYRDFISSVEVVYLKNIEKLSTSRRVEFDTNYHADYVRANPPSTGYLPPINIVVQDPTHSGSWLLDEIATGP